jgi:hypothetical protein
MALLAERSLKRRAVQAEVVVIVMALKAIAVVVRLNFMPWFWVLGLLNKLRGKHIYCQ